MKLTSKTARPKQKKKSEEQSRRLTSLLALDFAGSGIKAVRMKKQKDRLVLTGVDVLPAINPDVGERPILPKNLSAYYTAVCVSSPDAKLRVFGHAMQAGETLSDVIRSNLNVSEEQRVAGRMLMEGKGKRESSILGVSIPEDVVRGYLDLFSSGAPAPHAMELAGLAAFNAFLFNRGKSTAGQAVCLIEIGLNYTYTAFLHKNQMQLVNRFSVGGAHLRGQVQAALGVDADMAGTILTDGSVDVASPVKVALAPFVKQLSIYREYVERQTKMPLSGVYLSGGEAISPHWRNAVQEVTGLAPVTWNPFDRIDGVADVLPDTFKGQEPRFAAAVGAAVAGLEAL
jgi:hypothetical protein